MMRCAVWARCAVMCLLPLALWGCGQASDAPAPAAPASNLPTAPLVAPAPDPTTTAPGLPADVVEFKSSRDSCDQLRGEEASDDKRAAELDTLLDRYCKGTDAALAALRTRYAGRADVLEALKDYEAGIE
ncbi:MAG: hypothetical protein Q8S02_06890 [Hydrogenophaga sp.]|nr:hypothetical protein [Hydrogenophaga sp.]